MIRRVNYYTAKMSDDFVKLARLLDEGNVVVCFVNYIYDTGTRKILYRDVAKVHSNNYPQMSKNYGYIIESRGCVYGQWDKNMLELRKWTFRDECERLNLQYIDI